MAENEPPPSSRIFISYRRDDALGFVRALRSSLREKFSGEHVFKDTDNIQPGQDFVKAIRDELNSCRVLLAVIGSKWATIEDKKTHTRRLENPNDYLRLEIATALKNEHMVVIPVLVDRATMPTPEELPEDLEPLARRNAIELSDIRWDTDVERLVHAIENICREPLPSSRTVVDKAVPAPVKPAEPPPVEPRNVGRGGGAFAELLEAKRKRQIAEHVKGARQAFEKQDFEAVIAACERALLYDPQEPEALDLATRARDALDEVKIQEFLAQGKDALAKGDLAGASEAIDEALARSPSHPAAVQLRQDLLRARQDRERQREVERLVAGELRSARSSFDEEDFEVALNHVEDALSLAPESREALELQGRIVAARDEQRQLRELKRRAQLVVADARAEFADGKHEASLSRLEQFTPPHELVTRALEDLRRQAEAAKETARVAKAKQEAEREKAEQAKREEAARLAAATAAAEKARRDEAARLAAAAAAESAEREKEAQAKREQEDHAKREEAARLAAATAAAEKARREKDEQAKREEAARLAAAAVATERAEREREAHAKREKEDQAKREETARVAAAAAAEKAEREKDAQAKREKEEQTKREEAARLAAAAAAEKAEREKEAQAKRDEAARIAREEQVARAERDRRAREFEQRERERAKERQREEERERHRLQERAEADAPALEQPIVVEPPVAVSTSKSQAVPLAAAAAVLVVLIAGGWWALGRKPAVQEDQAASQPPPSSVVTTTPAAPAPPPAPDTPTATPDAATPPVVPTPGTTKPNDGANTAAKQLEGFRTQARAEQTAGRREPALAAVAAGLKIDPKDSTLLGVLDSLARDAQSASDRAKQTARTAGATPAEANFNQGLQREAEAAKLRDSNNKEAAARSFWSAEDNFAQSAERVKQNAADQTRQAEVARQAELARQKQLADQAAAEKRRADEDASRQRAADEVAAQQKRDADARAQSERQQSRGPSDEDRIQQVLNEYRSAYQQMDAAAVVRLHPTLQQNQLATVFGQYRSYTMTIANQKITITGNTAIVTCTIATSIRPRIGDTQNNNRPTTLRLQKSGDSWTIVDRR